MPGVGDIAVALAGGVLAFLAATVAFDVLHVLLHRMSGARHAWLRALGALHEVHHSFLDRDLRIHPERLRANLTHHVIPEYVTQLCATGILAFLLPWATVVVALALETLVFVLILRTRGIDINHRPYRQLPAYRPTFLFCVPHYHALHHVFPDAYFGSWLKLLDQILGSAARLRGRRAAIVGEPGPLGLALGRRLRSAGVPVCELPLEGLSPPAHWDIAILTDAANRPVEQWVESVEAALRNSPFRLVAPEIWIVAPRHGLSSDIARRSLGYLFDARVYWRHLVVPPGIDPDLAARRILSRIARGWHYVPAGGLLASLPDFVRLRFRLRPVAIGPRALILP